MTLLQLIERLRAHAGALLKAGWALLALLVLLDALPFVVDKSEAHTAAERLPGFWAVYGLAGCALLVFVAKALARLGIQQPKENHDE
ncbi:MAG: hypothetical protein ACLFS4_02930 [Opitutales bacterium]